MNCTKSYPYIWSVNQWLEGEVVNQANVDKPLLAVDIAGFLKELHGINATEGPEAGIHNFFRGGDLSVYHEETLEAIEQHRAKIDVEVCEAIWTTALSSKWERQAVWIHGDMAQGNLLAKNKRLAGVIDFGMLGIGDPACDLVMAWTFFDVDSRGIFIDEMALDGDTWNRVKGWALWKALITLDDCMSKQVIKRLVNDYKHK